MKMRKLFATAALIAATLYYPDDASATRSCNALIEECRYYFGCEAVFQYCAAGFCYADCPCDQ
jgi:hypothetical protein